MPRRLFVPMTPDQSVVWDAHNRPDLRGFVLTAPDCPQRAQKVIGLVATETMVNRAPNDVPDLRMVAGGESGLIYGLHSPNAPGSVPELALKVTRDQPSAFAFGCLQANVTLRQGLLRHRPAPRPRAGNPATYTAPHYYAAYFPYQDNTVGRPAWVMSYETGVRRRYVEVPRPGAQQIPPLAARRTVYEQALQTYGKPSSDYDLNLRRGDENELFGFSMIGGEPSLTIVKLDIRPSSTSTDPSLYELLSNTRAQ